MNSKEIAFLVEAFNALREYLLQDLLHVLDQHKKKIKIFF